jgi:hypothetical protein
MYPLEYGLWDAQSSIPALARGLAAQNQNAWLVLKELSYRV